MANQPPDFDNLRRLWNRGWPWLLAAVAGSLLTLWWDSADRAAALAAESQLKIRLAALQQQHGEVQQALAKASADLVVAYGRDEQNRKTLADLTTQLANAQQELAFFRSLVNPDGNASSGLVIEGVELQPLDAPRSFRFRLVVVQQGQHKSASKATVKVAVEGSDGLSPQTHDLLMLAGFDKAQRTISLRYFQVVEGTAVLPEGFAPSRLTVGVERSAARGLASTRAERSFVWADLVGHNDPVTEAGSMSDGADSAIVEQNSRE